MRLYSTVDINKKRGRVGRFVKFFYHKSLAPQSFGVGVHLDTRISTAFISFSVKYENEKKYVQNIIQLTEAQLTEKEIKAVEMRVSKWTPTPKVY
jgi:hypothetical protein